MDDFKTSTPPDAKLHFLDYWRVIRIRKAIIITVFLITAIIATAVTFILPESYASTARIRVQKDSTDIPGMETPSAAVMGYDPYFIQTTFEIMQSEVVLSNVIAHLNLNTKWGEKYFNGETLKTTETMEILKQRMQLAPVKNTELISITVYSDDKQEAADLANAIADAYSNYRIDQHKALSTKGMAVLEKQFGDLNKEIKGDEDSVENLRKELRIIDTPSATEPTPTIDNQQLQLINQQMIEGEKIYREDLVQLQKLQSIQEHNADKLRDVLPQIVNDGTLSDLVGKLNDAKHSWVTLTNDYSLSNIAVTRVQSLIDELNHEIDDRVAGIIAGLESQVDAKKAALDALKDSVEAAKVKDQEAAIKNQPYYQARRELEQKYDMRKLLYSKMAAEKIDTSLPNTSIAQVTDPAEPSKTPAKPNKTVNIILGLVFGLLMGIGLAFFIEYLDTSVKTIDDVERTFQAPVLGVIPQNIGYLLEEGSESKHAEAYRVLRTNILFSRKEDKLNTIVVVSAGAGEGKSTTTINLATVFAQAGNRVLIVDSDLRRPTLHKLFKVANNLGLTNYLLKQNTLAELVQTTPVPGLDFMASGRLPNSSMGILGSAQMKEMIAELKQRYDFIFFDSPPILGVSDASILASEVDLVMQVIQYRRYPQPMTIRAKQMIEKVRGNFIGIVLNNINMSQDEGYYYYSGYYHDYYYSRSPGDQDAEAAPADKSDAADNGETEVNIKRKY
jgi:capsular exopolysaccharide synthesis family protein